MTTDEVYLIGATGKIGYGIAEYPGNIACFDTSTGMSSKVSGVEGGHVRVSKATTEHSKNKVCSPTPVIL